MVGTAALSLYPCVLAHLSAHQVRGCGLFQLLATWAVNVGGQVLVWTCVSTFVGSIPGGIFKALTDLSGGLCPFASTSSVGSVP